METPIDQLQRLVEEFIVFHNVKKDFRNMSVLFTSHTFWYRCWEVLFLKFPDMLDVWENVSEIWQRCAMGLRWLRPRNLMTEGFPKKPQKCDAFVPIDGETGEPYKNVVTIIYDGKKWIKEGGSCADWDALMKEGQDAIR